MPFDLDRKWDVARTLARVAKSMAPLNCSTEQSTRMREFLKNSERFSPGIAKAMKVNLDEDERCQRVRAMSRL